MSKITFLFVFGILIFQTDLSHAQLGNMVPKSDLLSTLDDVKDLGFSDNDKDALFSQNEKFVNDIFKIMDGDQTEEDKKFALKNLKKENDEKLLGILGEDGVKQYKKKMKKAVRPYKRKAKLLSLVL